MNDPCMVLFEGIIVIVFNNVSVILVEETWEKHQTAASHWQFSSHNVICTSPEQDSNSQR